MGHLAGVLDALLAVFFFRGTEKGEQQAVAAVEGAPPGLALQRVGGRLESFAHLAAEIGVCVARVIERPAVDADRRAGRRNVGVVTERIKK